MLVARALSAAVKRADGNIHTEGPRATRYGEPYVNPLGPRVYADEGSYWIARNVTPGTGIAGHAAPTTHDTAKPFIFLKNNGPDRVYLDFLKLLVTAAGTAGSLNYATHTVDKDRTYSSGGEDLTVVKTNLAVTNDNPFSLAKAGAVVPAQANSASARIIAHQRVRTVIPVVGDEILFKFGGEPIGSGMALEGTTELQRIIHCPPVVLESGDSYHLVLWRASQSAAASYEVEIGGWYR